MLKFGIRQAGGCGRRPKNAKPTTKPNVHTQKKGSRPPKSPRGPPEAPRRRPEAPRRRPEAPRGPREAPEASEAGSPPENEGTRGPRKPPEAPEAPGRFRSSEGHERKSLQPFRKILKGYRSARDKTLDRSQADKGGVGI